MTFAIVIAILSLIFALRILTRPKPYHVREMDRQREMRRTWRGYYKANGESRKGEW